MTKEELTAMYVDAAEKNAALIKQVTTLYARVQELEDLYCNKVIELHSSYVDPLKSFETLYFELLERVYGEDKPS